MIAVLGDLDAAGPLPDWRGKTMARQFEQLKRMRKKADRQKEKARPAENPRLADKYLWQAENVLAAIQAIKGNWKKFGENARGNTNFKGVQHSREAREKMRIARKEFWASKAGFEKMWRARMRRRYWEEGKCVLRFPRLPASADKGWLKGYRERYKRVIGKRPEICLY